MRKFVIKNRQKRKYTKKSESISSFSFSKTAYSLLPFLIMLIAFMSTIIISAPFRDTLSNISFTFELPQFSLSNPLYFFQTLASDFSQIGLVMWTITQAVSGTLVQNVALTTGSVTSGIFLAINFLFICITGVLSGFFFVAQQMFLGVSSINQFSLFLQTATFEALYACALWISEETVLSGQFIFLKTIFGAQQFLLLLNYLSHITAFVLISIAHFLMFIGQVVLNAILSTITFIASVINHTGLAIVHTVEIPFKTLAAFGLLLKPYVAIFGKHVQMAGSDFSNGFSDMGKVTSLLSTHK